MAPTKQVYDYIVIGGGSGGSGAARRAAGWYKKKTLLIENGISGGCCVNVGCVPKKMTWNFASVAEMLRHSSHYGYSTPSNIPVDYRSFKDARDASIRRLNKAYETNWEREGIDLVHGTATFTAPHEISVQLSDGSGTAVFEAPHVCIATGSAPIVPTDVPGAEHGITNEGFFALENMPSSIAIVGAGYIAVEIAGLLNSVGVDVHLFIRGETFLRSFDPMIQEVMTEHYSKAGIHIHKGFKGIDRVEKTEGQDGEKILRVQTKDGETYEVGELLWAVGRAPEHKDLELEKIGIKLGRKGEIVVDEFQNTNVDGVYAIGDVTNQLQLTPVAIAAGRQLGNRLFGPPHLSSSKLDYQNVPSVVFSHPPVGTVGFTEPEAREHYPDVKVYKTQFASMFYYVFPEDSVKAPTAIKLIVQGPDEKVVGLHITGEGADEMLQGFGVAIKMGATKRDFDSCVSIHPTSAEEIVTLK